MLNPVTWVIWVGAALVTLSATRNPLYLALILLWIGLVLRATRSTSLSPPVPISPFKFGPVVVVLSALFNGLMVHAGSTVLFQLPLVWPLIGGPVTLESLAYGALNGLALTGILSAFIAFNQALPVRARVSLTPRAFYPVAVVVSIAMTFVPTTLRQFTQIKEAQAVRGHRVRGLKDWLPLLLPLLVGGLERALQLAEAMMARGFAGGESNAAAGTTRLMTVAGLLALLGGWLLQLVWEQKMPGAALMLLGGALVGSALWVAGRRIPRSVYRPYGWSVFDGVVIYCAAVAAGAFALSLPGLDKTSVFYYPYPRLAWPDFNPLIGLATVGLLGPVVVFLLRSSVRDNDYF